MPFEILHMDGVAIVRLTGSITGTDLVRAAQAIVTHPNFEAGRPRIWDARGIAQVLLDIEQARRLRSVLEEHIRKPGHGTGRTAIVVDRDIDRDVAEFIRWYLRGRHIEIFERMDEAQDWVQATQA